MRFDAPIALVLLLLAPLLLEASIRRRLLSSIGLRQAGSAPAVTVSLPLPLAKLGTTFRSRWRPAILSSILIGSYVLLVVALARPQTGTFFAESLSSGRDLMIALDVSGSMEALDFKLDGENVTRLKALQSVTKKFIEQRKGDRMGLIVFGSDVFTQCPLTLDQSVLSDFIDGLEIGMAGDGTALGDAIAVSLKKIKDIQADSKVLILMTDGMQTAGNLDPVESAKIAKELNIKIHTIGIGGNGRAPFKTKDPFGREVIEYADVPLDEKTLKTVAETTGGQYFRAANTESFAEVYQEIDKLEQREEKTLEYIEYEEHFMPFALAGFALFVVYELLAATVLL